MLPRLLSKPTWCPKIYYFNSLLCGIPDKLLNRIQRIQNCDTRVVLRLHKFSHITPALATLHRLPVNRQIDFKTALLVYKALNGQALQISCSPMIHPGSCARLTFVFVDFNGVDLPCVIQSINLMSVSGKPQIPVSFFLVKLWVLYFLRYGVVFQIKHIQNIFKIQIHLCRICQ